MKASTILYGGRKASTIPKHSRMGTARMKKDKETEEKGKTRGVSMKRNNAGTQKRNPNRLTIAQDYRSPRSLLPEEVDELSR